MNIYPCEAGRDDGPNQQSTENPQRVLWVQALQDEHVQVLRGRGFVAEVDYLEEARKQVYSVLQMNRTGCFQYMSCIST